MKPLVDRKDPKADKAKTIPDFEDLVSKLGEFGLYQKILYLALWLPAASMSIGIYSSVFLEFVPDYHCDSPCFKDDPNLANQLKNLDDASCTIPQPWLDSNHSTCQNGLEDIVKCQNFVYDPSIFESTAITDFNVVCDQAYLRTLSTTVSMCGLLFGSMFFGWISDAMGRRVAFGLCMLTLALGSTLAAFSVNYVMYMVFRFITCMGGVGAFITAFVLATEFVGKNYRAYCGILIEVPFALGELYITLLAYFIRDWKNLQASFKTLAIGIPFIGLLLMLIKLPESVRWAWAVGKFDQANKVIRDMTEVNKIEIPDEFILDESYGQSEEGGEEVKEAKPIGMSSLIACQALRGRLLVMGLNWVVATLAFYGLSLNAGIGSDVFSGFSLSACMEIPAYILAAVCAGFIGRKPFLIVVQVLCGLSCILAGSMTDPNLTLTFSLIGKFGSSAAFAIVFLYTAELFPTSMRNSAVGMCSTLARFGGILAPSVAQVGYYQPEIPYYIFGVATLIGGLCAWLLPETKGRKLPDTVEDAIGNSENLSSTEILVSSNEK